MHIIVFLKWTDFTHVLAYGYAWYFGGTRLSDIFITCDSWSNGCTEKWVWSSILTWNWKSTQSKPHPLKQIFEILKLKNWVSYLWDTSISLSGNWLTISWRKILCLNQSRSFDFWACLQKARLQKARYQARTYLQPHYANVVFGNVYLNIASTPLL